MARIRLVILGLVAAAFGVGLAADPTPAPPSAASATHAVALEGRTFTLPIGFTIERVAGPPLINRPVVGSFDDRGNLYVLDSGGSNAPPPEQLKNPTGRILRLSDTTGDGEFDSAAVFADKIAFSQGVLWHDGSVLISTPPQILKLTDTTGDGQADRREVWFEGQALTYCANDVHGPYAGPEGKIYWTKGAFGEQTVTLKGGQRFTTRAAHIYRANPDGSDMELVMSGGMDNPVDVAFLPNGEAFFTATYFQNPANGKRDGLSHVRFGAVFGKDHAPAHAQPWSDPILAEPTTHLGPAAPSGLLCLQTARWGPEYQGNLFCTQFNLARVSRHVPVESGSTYRTIDSDFVVCEDREFRPTDVVETPTGDLLILDTGGWYKLCCPSSVTEKQSVLGAIYRVRKVAAGAGEPEAARPSAEPAPSLRDASLRSRRRAAEAAARAGDRSAVPQLLEVLTDPTTDDTLETACTRALLEIQPIEELAAAQSAANPRVVRAAVTVLSQRAADRLDPAVVERLYAGENRSRAVAVRVAAKQDAIAAKLVGPALENGDDEALVRLARQGVVQDALAAAADAGSRRALEIMGRAKLSAPPAGWYAAVGRAVRASDPAVVASAVRTARGFPPAADQPEWTNALMSAAHNANLAAEVRLVAAAVAPQALNDELFALALTQLGRQEPGAVRAAAADALARADVSSPRLVQLAAVLPSVSPVELEKLLGLFTAATEAEVGRALVSALKDPTLRAALRPEQVTTATARFPEPVRQAAATLAAELAAADQDRIAKLDELLAATTGGDPRRGAAVFHSPKAACATCHNVGFVGGQVGPDLTRIGAVRSPRDLLESVIAPSASFVRSYEPVVVSTVDGKVFTGVLKTDAPDHVVIGVSATEEVRIERANVDELKPGTVSIMPAGLDQQLSRTELADLLAYLGTLK